VEIRTLWVDAICINQADNQEKMEQVKITAEIYKARYLGAHLPRRSGVLDYVSQEEQEGWDDAPRFE
jgi:hypothetical protein